MEKIKFDIVIVCFDDDDRLKTTIQSIIDSQFENKVIVQDGSLLESTAHYLEKMNKHLDIIHICEKDNGLYHAMNLAVNNVQQSYFLTLNCGDRLLTPEIPAYQESSLILCAVNVIFSDNEHSMKYKPEINMLHERMSCCHQGVIINKSLFRCLDGYDLKYKIAADYDFMIRAIKMSNVVLILSEVAIVSFEGDNGMSEKYRFLLEMETAKIKNKNNYKVLKLNVINYIIHFFRYIKFRLS